MESDVCLDKGTFSGEDAVGMSGETSSLPGL